MFMNGKSCLILLLLHKFCKNKSLRNNDTLYCILYFVASSHSLILKASVLMLVPDLLHFSYYWHVLYEAPGTGVYQQRTRELPD